MEMKKLLNGIYLSDAVDIKDLQYNCINLIKTNCGSGKTTFSLNELADSASDLSHVVYLTDSAAMRDSLGTNSRCKIYDPSDKAILNGELTVFEDGKIIVMTYAKMGLLLKFFPNTFDAVEIIICDEIHRIYDFIEMSRTKNRKEHPLANEKEIDFMITVDCGAYLAYTSIERMAAGLSLTDEKEIVKKKLIVGLSATPANAYVLFSKQINEIKVNAQLVAYETLHTIYYTDLANVITNFEQGNKVLFYVPYIHDIKKSIKIATKLGFKANGIWSLSNTKNPMDKEQLRIREYILTQQKLPEEYDFIFINAAYETSISICDDIRYMVINSMDKDVRIQARNRIRGDLKVQYLLAGDDREKKLITVPIQYLNKKLTPEEKKELCKVLNFRNKCGNTVSWTTTKKKLTEMGYSIKDGRTTVKGERFYYSLITYNEEGNK